MSEDLTQKLPKSDSEKLHLILTSTQNLEARFGKLESRVQDIDSRLGGLEQKLEERLYDTRPIWQKVVADIGQLQTGQQRLEEGQQRLEEGQQSTRLLLVELSGMVREVNRDQIVMNDVIRRIQLDFHNFDERLHRYLLNHKQQNSST
jgi:DNA repair ATPase RecN